MDEVGFMITKVDKSGLLRFHNVGGVEERLLPAKRVVIGDERVPGIVGSPVPHLQSAEQARKPLAADDLAIDIGATSDKQAQEKVKVGDYGTFATRFTVLSDDPKWPTVRGKAFDDRAGCAVLIALLAEAYPVDVLAVFTTQEEVGSRGARVAAYRLEPDAAFALEGTICDDSPKPPDDETTPVTRLGDGPAVTIMDRSFAAHPGILAAIRESAATEQIQFQYKTPLLGGTDAGPIHLSRAGVPSGTIAVPCRYIHGPAAILNLNDLSNTVRLAGAVLRRLERSYLVRNS
jgi:endoglucanase